MHDSSLITFANISANLYIQRQSSWMLYVISLYFIIKSFVINKQKIFADANLLISGGKFKNITFIQLRDIGQLRQIFSNE